MARLVMYVASSSACVCALARHFRVRSVTAVVVRRFDVISAGIRGYMQVDPHYCRSAGCDYLPCCNSAMCPLEEVTFGVPSSGPELPKQP